MYLDPFDSAHSGRIDAWDGRAAFFGIILGWLLVGCGVYFFKQLAPALHYTRFEWAGGTFFPVVLLCQFLVLAGNRVLVLHSTYVHRVSYHTVVVLC